MQKKDDLEVWWASLTVVQKERIAMKGLKKADPERRIDESEVTYPACSAWWTTLAPDTKQWIHDHCTGAHGYVLQDWNDANPYGD